MARNIINRIERSAEEAQIVVTGTSSSADLTYSRFSIVILNVSRFTSKSLGFRVLQIEG